MSGYASLVSTPYDVGSYDEQISPGAFAGTLSCRPDIQLLVNHEGLAAGPTVPPGQPGHLSLTEDYKGLRFDAQFDRDDPDARLVHRKVASGLMGSMLVCLQDRQPGLGMPTAPCAPSARSTWTAAMSQSSATELSDHQR